MNLVICICTYNRNIQLVKCLNSIEKIYFLNKFKIKIIIIDNTIYNHSYNLIKKISKKFKYKILHFNEKRKGVVYARNKCLQILKKLNPNFVCFFDDDCIIDKKWLINVLKIKNIYKANIITGPQLHDKDSTYNKKKIIFSNYFEKKYQFLSEVRWASTNNVFFKYDILKKINLSFDLTLNKFGMGEDQLFFSILNDNNHKIFWYKNIKVFEMKNLNRNRLSWLKIRSLKLGILGHHIDKVLYGKFIGFALNYIKSVYFLIASILQFFLFFIKHNRILSIIYFYRFFGKLIGPLVIKKIKF